MPETLDQLITRIEPVMQKALNLCEATTAEEAIAIRELRKWNRDGQTEPEPHIDTFLPRLDNYAHKYCSGLSGEEKEKIMSAAEKMHGAWGLYGHYYAKYCYEPLQELNRLKEGELKLQDAQIRIRQTLANYREAGQRGVHKMLDVVRQAHPIQVAGKEAIKEKVEHALNESIKHWPQYEAALEDFCAFRERGTSRPVDTSARSR